MRTSLLVASLVTGLFAASAAHAYPISKFEVTKVELFSKSYSTRLQGTLQGKPVTAFFFGPSGAAGRRFPANVLVGKGPTKYFKRGESTMLTKREVARFVKVLDAQAAASTKIGKTQRSWLKGVSENMRSMILE